MDALRCIYGRVSYNPAQEEVEIDPQRSQISWRWLINPLLIRRRRLAACPRCVRGHGAFDDRHVRRRRDGKVHGASILLTKINTVCAYVTSARMCENAVFGFTHEKMSGRSSPVWTAALPMIKSATNSSLHEQVVENKPKRLKKVWDKRTGRAGPEELLLFTDYSEWLHI